MFILKAVIIGIYSLTPSLTIAPSQDMCPVVRYTGSFKKRNHVKDHAILGRSYQNMTTSNVQECFSSCINDCRCVSYQLYGKRCELVDGDKYTTPSRFQRISGYQYYQLEQRLYKKSTSDACSSQCNNGCCRYFQPCLNGGTCIEMCQNVTEKFQCKCPPGFAGRVCETIGTSCVDYSAMSEPNIYRIHTTNETHLKVYCDMTSEPGMVWTLIESFALSKAEMFNNKPFTLDFLSSTENLSWTNYRLSLKTMQHIKSHATHWRATCNYDTDGLVKTDYIRGRLSEIDILTYTEGHTCTRVEYVNIRGISCQNCTTHFYQASQWHPVVDSGQGARFGCTWDGRKGSVGISENNRCNNFGVFIQNHINSAHRCAASQSSTTQWWLGSETGTE